MKKRNLLIIFFLFSGFYSLAQDANKIPLKEKLYYGGYFGLGYQGSNLYSSFYSELSPFVGYKITDNLSAGPGLILQYQRFTDNTVIPSKKYDLINYGLRLFARVNLFNNLFAHVEFEELSLNTTVYRFNTNSFGTKRIGVESLFMGLGYRSVGMESSGSEVLLLFNLNESGLTPYSNPTLRLGYVFGL